MTDMNDDWSGFQRIMMCGLSQCLTATPVRLDEQVSPPFGMPLDRNSAYPDYSHLDDLPSFKEIYPRIFEQREAAKAGTLYTCTVIVEKSDELFFAVKPGEEPYEALQRYCREVGIEPVKRHSEPRKAC